MATTYGQLNEFRPETESIAAYLERVEVFFQANTIAECKQVAVFLSVVGGKTYSLLRDLLSPQKPQEKTLVTLFETLKRHFEPKPLVTLRRCAGVAGHLDHRNKADKGRYVWLTENPCQMRRPPSLLCSRLGARLCTPLWSLLE